MADAIRYYGFVDGVIPSPDGPYYRTFLLLDCVNADIFDRTTDLPLNMQEGLALVRVMSTERRLHEDFGLGRVEEGDWIEFMIDDSGDLPRAWELQATNGYRIGRPRSFKPLRRLSRPRVQDAMDIVRSLAFATMVQPLARSAHVRSALREISRHLTGVVAIDVLDVGQGSAALISVDNAPVGFFDVGEAIWFNNASLPRAFSPPVITRGFVFLSHWDWDHFALGRRHAPYHQLRWFAPHQPVGPNTARFQHVLGSNLTFVSGHVRQASGVSLARGTSTKTRDRNGRGYQLRYVGSGETALLTGDTDYALIRSTMKRGLTAVTVPHHGSKGSPPPSPSGGVARAVVSYGNPNSYRHPCPNQMTAHVAAGWSLERTARYVRPRGDRRLIP